MEIRIGGQRCKVFKRVYAGKGEYVTVGVESPFVILTLPIGWDRLLDKGFNCDGLQISGSAAN